MKTAVILNPQACGGRAGKRWERWSGELRRRLGAVEVRRTERPGQGAELARELLGSGFDRIIGAGGDGTFNEVANGFIRDERPLRPGACMGIFPLGTGGDFQRTLGIPGDPAGAIEVLATGAPVEMDLGRIRCRGEDGAEHTRYFVNLTSFGMGGEVAARSRNLFGVLGGKAAFFWATLRMFLSYRGKEVELWLDGAAEPRRHKVLNVAVGNGCYHGGGMYVCPGALLDDGVLEVTVIDDLGLMTLLKDLAYLYNGRIYEHPKCRHFRVREIVARSREQTRIEVDGEPLGVLPLEITVLPRSLRVLAPRPSNRLNLVIS